MLSIYLLTNRNDDFDVVRCTWLIENCLSIIIGTVKFGQVHQDDKEYLTKYTIVYTVHSLKNIQKKIPSASICILFVIYI